MAKVKLNRRGRKMLSATKRASPKSTPKTVGVAWYKEGVTVEDMLEHLRGKPSRR